MTDERPMKLSNLRVLDLSLFLPGPLTTQMLADHGAEVIKIESVSDGEPTREIGLKRDGVSVYFANTQRGKKSLALDLKADEGRAIFLRLAECADVIVEGFRPGVVERLGIGYGVVAARNPKIVYASISAFGQTGPYVSRPAHDAACEGLAGILSVNLGQDDKPWLPAMTNADMLASLFALSGILMALLRRQATGRGDYLDVAMMDSLIACMPNNLGAVMAEKRAPVAKDERAWGGNALYRLYETRDAKWVVLAGGEAKFAANLLTALGRPDLIERCARPAGPDHRPVIAFLDQAFRTKTQEEWVAWFEGRDICFAPVRDLREALDDPQLRAREMVLVDDRGWEHIGIPVKFAGEPGRVNFDVARHGEHGAEILRGLGYRNEEVEDLVARGIVRS
jgi:crotonobetainyl-CoA:carnitine CoA-transferase CaiB-like acyl-CoA transferase